MTCWLCGFLFVAAAMVVLTVAIMVYLVTRR